MKYVIVRPENSCGICGYIWQVIRGIYHNPNKQYYIDFCNCLYRDPAFSLISNPWEYYFKQPCTDKQPSTNEIEGIVGLIDTPVSEFRDVFMVNPTPELIQSRRNAFHDIIKKYIIPLPHIQQKIDTFVDSNFKNKKILGLHLRGTDHPDKKPMQHYMQFIKDKLMDYDKLFVCSDEQYRVNFCKVVFGDRVITHDSYRSDSPAPLHYKPVTENYQHKIGEDAIIESYLMSKCNFLICCSNSNVNYLSRAINPNLPSIAL